MTIRERINEYRNIISDSSNLSPVQASRFIVELSSYIGNINEKLLESQMAFNQIKSDFLDEIKSVAKAEVKAQCTDEYRQLQEIKGYQSLVTEMIRGLKYYCRSLEDEKQFSKNT